MLKKNSRICLPRHLPGVRFQPLLRSPAAMPLIVSRIARLGYGAVEFLLNRSKLAATIGGSLVCLVNGELQFLKFEDLLAAETKQTTVRAVDLFKPSYSKDLTSHALPRVASRAIVIAKLRTMAVPSHTAQNLIRIS
jgi:hypothetical protein